MQRDRLIVLKFGGSVLRDEDRLRIAVHEIYRWRREGWAVVAVVSALAGATDDLLQKAGQLGLGSDLFATANLLATGETTSAALLGSHLDRAGVPACVLSPASLALEAEGSPLDADPCSLNDAGLRRAFARGEVAVVPGFVALDNEKRTVVLGRGGSDLTALFLASRLRAKRCRLVKDVDGLYERDPALASLERSAPPRRFAQATFADALGLDGSICQHKALRFARAEGLSFELGRWNGTNPTLVGADRTVLEEAPSPGAPLRVALLGHGTVGGGVREALLRSPDLFEIVGVAVRDLNKHEPGPEFWSQDSLAVAGLGADVVVETIGGSEVARECILHALKSGSHVVTANKMVLAEHGAELFSAADGAGLSLEASAAAGGSTPVLETALRSPDVVRLRGVLNATTGDVLGRVARGAVLEEALTEARFAGLAEADSTRDLDGSDALDKLILLASALRRARGEGSLSLESSKGPALCEEQLATWARVDRVRQVGTLHIEQGRAEASVELAELDPADALLQAHGDENLVEFYDASGTRVALVAGRGGGRLPTTEAVVADLLQLAREGRSATTSTRESA